MPTRCSRRRRRPTASTHRLWAITDRRTALPPIADDLPARRALIADGHHRYATYRELQHEQDREPGAGTVGPGLDAAGGLVRRMGRRYTRSTECCPGFEFAQAVAGASERIVVEPADDVNAGLERLHGSNEFRGGDHRW